MSFMVKKLELPYQCLPCAYVLIQRALPAMFADKFFMSMYTVQK